MNRFKPSSSSSAQLVSDAPDLYDEWRWPCGCVVFSDDSGFRLYPCTSSNCIRDAETPWAPPGLREKDKEFRCAECLWTGNVQDAGLWTPPSSSAFDDPEQQAVCPACRSDIKPVEPTRPKVISDAARLGWCIGCKHYNPSYQVEAVCDRLELREPVLGLRRTCREIRAGYTDCPYFTAMEVKS